MKIQLQKRLGDLKTEYESGQKALTELEGREVNIRTILQRISGAIQVLEEELAKAGQSEQADDQPSLTADTSSLQESVPENEKIGKKIRAV